MIFDDEMPTTPPVISIPRPRPGNNQYPLFWTEDRIAQLRELWANGLSGSMIGREMGNTRSAIMGKVHRLQLPTRRPENWKDDIKKFKTTQERNTKRIKAKISGSRYGETTDILCDVADNAVTLMQLEPHHCRWPCFTRGTELMFCGGNAIDGHSYCARHCRMAYEPPGQRRRAPVKYWSRNGAAVR